MGGEVKCVDGWGLQLQVWQQKFREALH